MKNPTRQNRKSSFWIRIVLFLIIAFFSIFAILGALYQNNWVILSLILGLFIAQIALSSWGSGLLFKTATKKLDASGKKEKTSHKIKVISREVAIDALYEHLKQIGLDVTVDWKEQDLKISTWELFLGFFAPKPHTGIIGSIKVANRNIDAVELDWQIWDVGGSEATAFAHMYRCDYIVKINVTGLSSKLEAESKPIIVKTGFLKTEITDYKWIGKELAFILNNDFELKTMLYPSDKLDWRKKRIWTIMGHGFGGFIQSEPYNIEIVPDEEKQYVRISQNYYCCDFPATAFPTLETFEAYDKIAGHIRSMAELS